MNTKKVIASFSFVLLHWNAMAQSDTLLASFGTLRDGNVIRLTCVIKGGYTCNGIRIYRAEDTLSFTQIGDIPGICGSTSNPVTYSFDDINPIPNKKNYYRLGLGSLGLTKFVSIEFIVLNNGYLIRPQPVSETATIYFDNPNNTSYTFKLFTEKGELMQMIENIKSDFISFSRNGLSEGTYIFTLESGDKIRVKGKIVVL